MAPLFGPLMPLCKDDLCATSYPLPNLQATFMLPMPRSELSIEGGSVKWDETGRTQSFTKDGAPIPAITSVKYPAVLTIGADGRVLSVTFENPQMDRTEVAEALRSWRFDTTKTGAVLPIDHRIVVEVAWEGRPRHPYGRPWTEFDLDHVRLVTHPTLPIFD